MEPNVSVPVAIVVRPAAKAALLPPLEPPGIYSMFQGFRVVPKYGLVPVEPAASSCRFSFPNIMVPAPNSFFTTVAVVLGMKSANNLEPTVVRIPFV